MSPGAARGRAVSRGAVRGRAVAATALFAACGAHHAPLVDMPDSCAAHGDVGACAGWALDMVYRGAHDASYDDAALSAYVTAVAHRIGAVAGVDDLTVRLIDADDAEASALGGGIVYVDRGVLARLDSEAELAGLLAHEITHLAADHTLDVLHSGDDDAASDVERLRRRDDDEALADERAVQLVAAAGYDPSAVLSMMRAIQRNADGTEPPADAGLDDVAPVADHPPVAVRLARIARLVAGRRGGEVGRAAYLAHLDGLVVGADPRRGHVTGATWVRARSGLAADLPGWTLAVDDSDYGRVVATAPGGKRGVEISAIGATWAGALRQLLVHPLALRTAGRAVLLGEMPPSTTETAPNGDTKITVSAADGSSLVAIVDDGDRALMLTGSGDAPRAALVDVLAHLRAARADEVAAIRPHRLRLVAAPRPGTVAALTAALCPDPAAVRALDDPARAVAAGEPVKCVVP